MLSVHAVRLSTESSNATGLDISYLHLCGQHTFFFLTGLQGHTSNNIGRKVEGLTKRKAANMNNLSPDLKTENGSIRVLKSNLIWQKSSKDVPAFSPGLKHNKLTKSLHCV